MKKALNVAMVVIGTAVGLVTQIVLLAATATVYPVSKAWHEGRLSAERAHAMHSTLDQLASAFETAAKAKAASEPGDSLGQYL